MQGSIHNYIDISATNNIKKKKVLLQNIFNAQCVKIVSL